MSTNIDRVTMRDLISLMKEMRDDMKDMKTEILTRVAKNEDDIEALQGAENKRKGLDFLTNGAFATAVSALVTYIMSLITGRSS